MVNYEQAIKRPFTDIKKLAIGVIIQLIPIVNFIALGYQLGCAKTAMEKKFELPEWTEWGNLFVNGLKAVVIGVIYMLPALIIGSIVGFSAIIATAGQGDVSTAELAGAGIGVLIAFFLALIAAYFLPSGILSFVRDDKFGEAFKFREVFKRAFKVNYLVVWIVMTAYTLILGIILSIIPFIGTAFASFICYVTAMTAFGELYPEL